MDIQDIQSGAKKYWPYLLGGVIGIYVIYKFTSSGQTQTVQYSGVQAFDPAQAAYALQSQGATASYNLELQKMNVSAQLQERALQIQFLESQANAASNVSSGASEVIAALQKPTIASINAAAAENAATVMSAAALASANFAARADITQAALMSSAIMASAINDGSSGISNAVIASANASGAQVNAVGSAISNTSAANSASDSSMWSAIGTLAVAYFSGGTVWV